VAACAPSNHRPVDHLTDVDRPGPGRRLWRRIALLAGRILNNTPATTAAIIVAAAMAHDWLKS
jgi:hypothetical protein